MRAVTLRFCTLTWVPVGQLLLSRDAILPTRQEQATEDSEFDLVTWLVIKEAGA